MCGRVIYTAADTVRNSSEDAGGPWTQSRSAALPGGPRSRHVINSTTSSTLVPCQQGNPLLPAQFRLTQTHTHTAARAEEGRRLHTAGATVQVCSPIISPSECLCAAGTHRPSDSWMKSFVLLAEVPAVPVRTCRGNRSACLQRLCCPPCVLLHFTKFHLLMCWQLDGEQVSLQPTSLQSSLKSRSTHQRRERWHFQYSAMIFNMFNWRFFMPMEGPFINLLCNFPYLFFLWLIGCLKRLCRLLVALRWVISLARPH